MDLEIGGCCEVVYVIKLRVIESMLILFELIFIYVVSFCHLLYVVSKLSINVSFSCSLSGDYPYQNQWQLTIILIKFNSVPCYTLATFTATFVESSTIINIAGNVYSVEL